MSNFNGHLIGGVVVSAIAAGTAYAYHQLDATTASVAFGMGVFASLYADIDIKSHSSRIISLLCTIPAIWWWYNGNTQFAVIAGLMILIPQFLPHRGFTHSHVCGILISAILCNFYHPHVTHTMLIVFGITYAGYCAHLLMDGILFKRFI